MEKIRRSFSEMNTSALPIFFEKNNNLKEEEKIRRLFSEMNTSTLSIFFEKNNNLKEGEKNSLKQITSILPIFLRINNLKEEEKIRRLFSEMNTSALPIFFENKIIMLWQICYTHMKVKDCLI